MKIKNNKKFLFIIIPLLLVVGTFLLGNNVLAANDWAARVIGGIIGIFISALGVILVLAIKGLMLIASYQHFIDSTAVVQGWVIVRDVCNMFFVVILLIIAFGTILHLENYSYKKWLPKLILMAVLINFSKTICGLLIDVAQVPMLTFVNAFKDVGGANMTEILGIKEIVTFAKDNNQSDFWIIIGAYVLGFIYMVISIIVIVTMIAMLTMRLVMIWIYVVLSPFAYLLSAFPGGSKYASQWWDEFIKNLIVGPVLAFFIWLSFAALTATDLGFNNINQANEEAAAEISALSGVTVTTGSSGDAQAATQASTPEALIKFVIAIGMLLGGLQISQQIGGAAGKMASQGMSAVNKFGSIGKKAALGVVGGVGLLAKQPFSWGADTLHEKTGVDLNFKRAWGVMQAKRKENKEKKYAAGQQASRTAMEEGSRVHGILAMTGDPGDAWDQMTTWKGFTKRLKGGKFMKKKLDKYVPQRETLDKQLERESFETDFMEQEADSDEQKKMRDEARSKVNTSEAKIKAADYQLGITNKEITNEEAKGKNSDPDKLTNLRESKNKLEEEKKQAAAERDTWASSAAPIKREKIRDEAKEKTVDAAARIKLTNNKLREFDQQIAAEEATGKYKNVDKLTDLRKSKSAVEQEKQQAVEEHDSWLSKSTWATNNLRTDFSDQEKFKAREKASLTKTQADKMEQKMESNTPEYNYEARATEQQATSQETSKIKDISDPTELLRILKDAIKAHDKTMVKAITLKMTRDYNDNEFLQPLAGRTDHIGLKDLMRGFADKSSKNYAGFGQQEAFGLGSQIAELNKNTNHWGASSAYVTENGRWRETTNEEHNKIRDIETGKQQLQGFIRNNNRLAYGYHDKSGTFHIDAGGLIKLIGIDTDAGHKSIATMNESAAKHVYDAIMRDDKLKARFSQAYGADGHSLIRELEGRLGELKKGDFESNYRQVREYT